MEATQAHLLTLLDGKKQFKIPIYQRTYSWQIKQCQQLFEDIIRVGNESDKVSHFIGSIVYFRPGNSPVTSIAEFLVIDSQQRLTTVSLLLLSLVHFLKEHEDLVLEDESWEEIIEAYLINKRRKDDSKYKLLLTRRDKSTLTRLIDEIDIEGKYSSRILENYQFFKGKLHADNIQAIYHGIKKLIIVDVALERDKDNPQLIFESLNSTGLDLSQADLIRNYILMAQPLDLQNTLYEKYWYPMEQSFGEKITSLTSFIRDYLTMKESAIPNIRLVYETYKRFLTSSSGFNSIEEAIQDLHRYSKFYIRFALSKEADPDIAQKFREITKLKIDTSYPFLLAIYYDYEKELISKEEFLEIIALVASYVFRRVICGIPTNSLNKTFATLHRKIKPESYLESLKAAFLLMDGYRRFPSDAEFAKELQVKDVYNLRARNYLLESLENWNRKEWIHTDNYTIEHILPQNPNLSREWRAELGEDWKNVQDKYLHTLGNLSLTGYNSELSDRPFSEKKVIHGGFDSSPLFLNESVRSTQVWNEASILKRASLLADRALQVWCRPSLSEDQIRIYQNSKSKLGQAVYTLEHYNQLQGELLNLYNSLEKRILNLDSSIRVEFKKLYIAFKAQTNFVDVIPQKKQLVLSLNIPYEQIKDPEDICIDVTGMRRWGNGDVEVKLDNYSKLDYIMELIEQAFEEQVERV